MMTPNDLFGLEGKVALVTGGATGIGRMAATGLVAAGARVLIASRKGEACEKVAEELNALGLPGSAEGFAGEVASAEGVAELAAEVQKRTDKLHILMNNAGRTWGEPLASFPFEAWEKVMSLNVAGMFQLTRDLLPLLEASTTADDPARVVNVGSVMGEVPMGHGAYSYAVSKAGVHHMTRILATELARRHVTVNAIAPGPFQSGMTAFAIGSDDGAAKAGSRMPLGRVGRPEDIAGCLQFLCGRGGSYITGAIIPVSGGSNVEVGEPLFQ